MKLLLDSDFLIALYKPDDSNHSDSKKIFKKIASDELYASNLVFQESTTVISKKMGMNDAKNFFSGITSLIRNKIELDPFLEEESWKLFLKQTKKGTSFIDCANLKTLEEYKLDKIISFDGFYSKDILFTV